MMDRVVDLVMALNSKTELELELAQVTHELCEI